MPGQGDLLIGLVAAPDARDQAEALAQRLPEALRGRIGEHVNWRAEVCDAGPADLGADQSE